MEFDLAQSTPTLTLVPSPFCPLQPFSNRAYDMSALRSFRATDLFTFNNVNMDVWTETYGTTFYLNYLARWPDLCLVQESPNGRMMGYIIGKAEGHDTEWHGHITAVTVAPEYRRLALAGNLCRRLERTSEEPYHGFFVDLYVRRSNDVAIGMYERMGYSVFRCVKDYYANLGPGMAGAEDAYDMRKPLSRDPLRKSVRANGREIISHTARGPRGSSASYAPSDVFQPLSRSRVGAVHLPGR